MEISSLNQYTLRRFRDLFASLEVPEAQNLAGKYRGTFVGPAWVRMLAGPALRIAGLGGWWGKDVQEGGKTINIVLRKGKFSTRFHMEFVREKSHIDGGDGIALHYQKGNPFPWMFIVDEIRRIDENRLLGMTRANIPGLRWFAGGVRPPRRHVVTEQAAKIRVNFDDKDPGAGHGAGLPGWRGATGR